MSRNLGIFRSAKGWEVDKVVHGQRLRDHFKLEKDAKEWLSLRMAEIDRIVRFGDIPRISFTEAVDRRLREKLAAGMPSAEADSFHLKALLPFVGKLDLTQISDASFDEFRHHCTGAGKAAKTIHLSISAAQAILNLASSKWRTPHSNVPCLQNPPRLSLPTLAGNQRKPRPISWDEEARLISELPTHLKGPGSFAINTGARDNVVVNLRWTWLLDVPKLGNRIAIVPKEFVKGRTDRRVLVLNQNALDAIEMQRGMHPEYVFVCLRRMPTPSGTNPMPAFGPFETLNNTAWQSARLRAGLGDLHVHDLRHTFAARLAAAGVSEDVISALLWHSSNSITQHYMGKQLLRMQSAVDLIVERPQDEDISITALIGQHATIRPRGG